MLLQALFKVPQTQANSQGKQRRRRSNDHRKWWVISVSVHRSRTFSPISVVNYCHHCASWEKNGQAFPLLPSPSPSPFHFFFVFFCSRSNNSTGNACYAGYPAIETSNWCLLIGPFIGDELRKSTKAVVAENFNLDLAFIRQLSSKCMPQLDVILGHTITVNPIEGASFNLNLSKIYCTVNHCLTIVCLCLPRNY